MTPPSLLIEGECVRRMDGTLGWEMTVRWADA